MIFIGTLGAAEIAVHTSASTSTSSTARPRVMGRHIISLSQLQIGNVHPGDSIMIYRLSDIMSACTIGGTKSQSGVHHIK